MENKLGFGNTFFALLVAAFTTGMGNGSVFGSAVICSVGRGPYDSGGGWGAEAYSPTTFTGFVDCMMLLFGLIFALIVGFAWRKHGQMEASGQATSEW